MRVVDIEKLPASVPAKHDKVYARQIHGPTTGCTKVSVSYTLMKADGGAPMDIHPDSDHVWYVLEGELQIDTGKEKCMVPKGQALVVEAGEAHSVTGTGTRDCVYLVVTCPPSSLPR